MLVQLNFWNFCNSAVFKQDNLVVSFVLPSSAECFRCITSKFLKISSRSSRLMVPSPSWSYFRKTSWETASSPTFCESSGEYSMSQHYIWLLPLMESIANMSESLPHSFVTWRRFWQNHLNRQDSIGTKMKSCSQHLQCSWTSTYQVLHISSEQSKNTQKQRNVIYNCFYLGICC